MKRLVPALCALLLLISVGGCGTANVFDPNFIASRSFLMSITPTNRTMDQNGTTTFTITLTSVNGFNNPVNISVTGVPNGADSSFTTPIVPTAEGPQPHSRSPQTLAQRSSADVPPISAPTPSV
jgi:hypothetical protein